MVKHREKNPAVLIVLIAFAGAGVLAKLTVAAVEGSAAGSGAGYVGMWGHIFLAVRCSSWPERPLPGACEPLTCSNNWGTALPRSCRRFSPQDATGSASAAQDRRLDLPDDKERLLTAARDEFEAMWSGSGRLDGRICSAHGTVRKFSQTSTPGLGPRRRSVRRACLSSMSGQKDSGPRRAAPAAVFIKVGYRDTLRGRGRNGANVTSSRRRVHDFSVG
jgi:hypothetical protein